MLIEHRGKRPTIHPTAYIAPSAVISGDVEIGAESRILHGAIITSEGAPISIGKHCIVMEHAVIRGAGEKTRSFPVSIGDETLIGPHTYLVGMSDRPLMLHRDRGCDFQPGPSQHGVSGHRRWDCSCEHDPQGSASGATPACCH